MPKTHEIIKRLNNLANDTDRVEELLNEPSHGEKLSLIRRFVEECPEDISEILQTISTPELRSQVMTFHDKKPNSPLDALNPTHVPAVLKLFTEKDRLAYIRHRDSDAKKYGDITKPEFKCINYIIYCDLYLEYLLKSKDSHPTYSQDLTEKKIKAIETARSILTDKPESEETMQEFHTYLNSQKETLTQHRDTRLTSFLKSIGLECLVDLACNTFFAKTDGKVLLEKIEAIETIKQTKP